MKTIAMSYRGLTFGDSDQQVRLLSVEGLDDLETDGDVAALAEAHGGVPVGGYARSREIEVELALIPDVATREQLRTAVKTAFAPLVDVEAPLLIDWDGEAPVQLDCAVRARASKRDQSSEFGAPIFVVRLEASDPVLYAQTLQTTVVPIFAGAGGVAYPVTYPKSYGGGGTGGGVQITNGGGWQTWPRLLIDGPTSGVLTVDRIENVTIGSALVFTRAGGLQVPAGKRVVVETHPARRSVRFTDGVSRYETVIAEPDWWALEPGVNEVRFRAGGETAGAQLTVEHRDAWL
jgi:hypothetical protein